MTHPTEQFTDYLLGALSPEETADLEAHLESCEACLDELDRQSAPLVALTESLPLETPPERTWLALQKRFAEAKHARERATESQRPESEIIQDRRIPAARSYPWLAAACLALLALAGLFYGVQSERALETALAEQAKVTALLARPEVQKIALENVLENAVEPPLGSLLVVPQGEALFVLAAAPPAGRAYQAWGHIGSDWNPDSGETLESLGLSRTHIVAVDPGGFAALYLSLEPAGGSPQPTEPLSKVSLLAARPTAPIIVLRPESGTVTTSDSVIVSGEVADGVSELRYRLNAGAFTQTASAGNRFTFTVSGLEPGSNTVELRANAAMSEISASVTVIYSPE